MFFDRCEIHIQAFLDFISAIAIIFKSSSPQNYFWTKVVSHDQSASARALHVEIPAVQAQQQSSSVENAKKKKVHIYAYTS